MWSSRLDDYTVFCLANRQMFSPTELVQWFVCSFLSESVVCEYHRRAAVSKIIKPAHLPPATKPQLKAQRCLM